MPIYEIRKEKRLYPNGTQTPPRELQLSGDFNIIWEKDTKAASFFLYMQDNPGQHLTVLAFIMTANQYSENWKPDLTEW